MQNEVESSSERLPLTEQAFLRLRRDVMVGVYAPGKKLKLDELQTSYGFSSSPLREALSRLSQEGLIRSDERRGFRVPEITKEDLDDIARLRLLNEVPALELAIAHGDDTWEAAIVAAHYRLDKMERQLSDGPVILDDAWIDAHRDFHMALLAGCQSERLRLLCSSMFDQAERYRQFSAKFRKTSRRKSSEHKRLMEAVLKRDAATARVLLIDHIQSTQRNVIAVLDLALNAPPNNEERKT